MPGEGPDPSPGEGVTGPDLRPVSRRLAHQRQKQAPPIQARREPTGHARLAASPPRQPPAEVLPAAHAHARRRPLTPPPSRASWRHAREPRPHAGTPPRRRPALVRRRRAPRRHGAGPLPAAPWRRCGPYRRAGVFLSAPQAARGRRQGDRRSPADGLTGTRGHCPRLPACLIPADAGARCSDADRRSRAAGLGALSSGPPHCNAGATVGAFSPLARAAAGTRPTGSRAPGSTRLSARGRAHARPAPGRSRTASMTRSPVPAPMGAPSRIPADNTTKPVDTRPSGN